MYADVLTKMPATNEVAAHCRAGSSTVALTCSSLQHATCHTWI